MSVREELELLGLKPNKALGQNFLIDEAAISAIVSAAVAPGLPVIEIGPGLGALTVGIAQSGVSLAAVELDAHMAEVLREKLAPYPAASVINKDILKTDLEAVHASLGGGDVCIAGNLPYYITSPVCERLVCSGLPIRRMVLMMQKEAADRFFAEEGDKNYVPLTVMSRLLFNVSRMLELGPASYFPQPEVASSVLLFERSAEELPACMPSLLKCAFAMRRKTLYNNLPALGITKQKAAELIDRAGLPPQVRAEALSPQEFLQLARLFEEERENE